METGKVENAPDYKSKKRLPTIKEMSGSIDFGGRVIFEEDEQIVIPTEEAKRRDHQKLQQAVVEAAKSLRQAELYPAADWPIERERENFRRYVDALIAFEAEHGIRADHG